MHQVNSHYVESEILHKQALEIGENILGLDHPHTSYSMHGLGNLMIQMGEQEGGAELLNRSLISQKKSLGSTHPYLAITYQSIAKLMHLQNKPSFADAYNHKALEILESVYPENHHSLAGLMHSMAHIKHELGDYVSAHLFHAKNVKIREDSLGHDHKLTHMSRHSMKLFMENNLNVVAKEEETGFDKFKKMKIIHLILNLFKK